MANEKLCFKDYLSCPDDKMLSKTRKKMNAKSPKKRVYGLDWSVSGPVNISGAPDGGAAMGESNMMEMHNGNIPGTFTADTLGGVQAATRGSDDMKKENRRSAPHKKMRLSKWLSYRTRAEDEEWDVRVSSMGRKGDGFKTEGRVVIESPFGKQYSYDPVRDAAKIEKIKQMIVSGKSDYKIVQDVGEEEEGDSVGRGYGGGRELGDMYDEVEMMVLKGVDNPEDIADRLGISPREVVGYLQDMGDYNPQEEEEGIMSPEKWLQYRVNADDEEEDYDDEDEDEDADEFSDEGIDDEEDYEDFEDTFDDEEDYDLDDEEDPDAEDEDLADEEDYDEEDDIDELDFNDEYSEHDLDREFQSDYDDEDETDDEEVGAEDEFDDTASMMMDRIGNEDEPEDEFSDEDLDSEDQSYNPDDEEDDEFADMADKMVDSISDEVIDDIDDTTGSIQKWWREQVIRKRPSEEEAEAVQAVQPVKPIGGFRGGAGGGATQEVPKIDKARQIFPQLVQQDLSRSDIIASFVNDLDVTQSTAVSYYEKIAKEMGMTGEEEPMGRAGGGGGPAAPDQSQMQQPMDMMPPETDMVNDVEELPVSTNPDRQGIIRTVDNAHLVYKRQTEDGTFEELWVYNIGTGVKDELKVRRAILAGTDIPQNKTQSEDGSQGYTLQTMGNAQMLHISGLPN